MRVETFIGRRHLFNRERLLRVRLTTAIAMLSVAFGVAALIVVLAVLDGMDANFHQKYMDLVSHIEALPPAGAEDEIFADPAAVGAALAADPHVLAMAPLVRREVMLLPERDLSARRTAVDLHGVDPDQTREVARFVDRAVVGTGEPGPDEIVVGQILANQLLGVRPGDTVWATTRITIDAHFMPHMRWAPLRVAGLFVTGVPELDARVAYTDLETARRIFRLPDDAVSLYQMRVADPYRAREAAEAIAAANPALGAQLRSWDQTNAEFFSALQLEKVGTMVMLVMIVLVGVFNIVGTLVMIITERTREIGMLKAMGADDGLIRRVFLRGGLLIGAVGTASGLALGLGICAAISTMPLPLALYDLTTVPVLIHWPTVALIAGATLGVCALASVLPAQTAARLDPVEALRFD